MLRRRDHLFRRADPAQLPATSAPRQLLQVRGHFTGQVVGLVSCGRCDSQPGRLHRGLIFSGYGHRVGRRSPGRQAAGGAGAGL